MKMMTPAIHEPLNKLDFCGEVGLVIRLHQLLGGVRSVTVALKVVEEMQEGLQDIKESEKKRKLDGMGVSR